MGCLIMAVGQRNPRVLRVPGVLHQVILSKALGLKPIPEPSELQVPLRKSNLYPVENLLDDSLWLFYPWPKVVANGTFRAVTG